MRIAAPTRFSFDTFDAHRTGESSVAEVLGRTHSRLIEWDEFATATLRDDLASGWQLPDDATLIFELHPNARWHPRDPLGGRELTADDVAFSLTRKLELARSGGLPLAQRGPDWDAIARIDAPDSRTVVVRLGTPDPLVLGALAGEFAFIQPPEAVEAFESTWQQRRSATVVGTGPWIYGGFQESGLVFERFDGGHRTANLDALHIVEPQQVAGRLLDGSIDEAMTRDRRDAAAVRGSDGFAEFARFEREHVMSTFALDAAPWNDPGLITALSAALNRGWLAEALFGGRAVPSGPVPPVHDGWTVSFAGLPGYSGDPASDASDARQRWDTAGGPALGTVTVDFPSIFDPLYSASSVVIERLNTVLGPQFVPAVETYTLISQRVGSGYYGNGRAATWFGWGPPIPSPDPTRWFAETYRPGALLSGVDAGAFEALRSEHSNDARRDRVRALGRRVAEAAFCGVVPWVQQRSELFRRHGFEGGEVTPFWPQHHDASRYRTAR